MLWLTSVLIVICMFILNKVEQALTINQVQDALLKDILNDYRTFSRPEPVNKPLMLHINTEIQHFDFRPRDGALHLVGLLRVKWHDPKLVWNPHSYGHLNHILLNPKRIWVPDLEIYNNIPNKFIEMHRTGFASVKSDGTVFWSDSIEANIFCETYMKNWPHDKHECTLILGSWTHDGLEIDIMHLDPKSTMTFRSVDMENMEYKITKFSVSRVSKYYSCCENPYISMNYDITFERKSSYVVIFRMVALCIILLTLIAMRIEPNRREKLWLNNISFILISGQLMYFATNIGNFTRDTPYIVIFFSTSLVMVTIAQLLAVFSLFATHSSFKGCLPRLIEKFINSPFTKYLVPLEMKNEHHMETVGQFAEIKLNDTSNSIDRNVSSSGWIRFAKILNFLIFLTFSFIFIVLASVCFV